MAFEKIALRCFEWKNNWQHLEKSFCRLWTGNDIFSAQVDKTRRRIGDKFSEKSDRICDLNLIILFSRRREKLFSYFFFFQGCIWKIKTENVFFFSFSFWFYGSYILGHWQIKEWDSSNQDKWALLNRSHFLIDLGSKKYMWYQRKK